MKKLILMFIFLCVLVSCDTNKITYETQRTPEVVFEEGNRITLITDDEKADQANDELSKYSEYIKNKNFAYNDIIEQDPIVTLLKSDLCQRTFYCKVYSGYILESYAYRSDSLYMDSYFVYDFGNYQIYGYNNPQDTHVPYAILDLKENWKSKFGCKFDYNTEEYSGIVDDGTKCDSMYRSEIEFWTDKVNALRMLTNKEFDFVKNDTAIDKELVDQYRGKLIEYIDTNYLK